MHLENPLTFAEMQKMARPATSGWTLCYIRMIVVGGESFLVHKGRKWGYFLFTDVYPLFSKFWVQTPLGSYLLAKSHCLTDGVAHCVNKVIIPLTWNWLNMYLSLKEKLKETCFSKKFVMSSVYEDGLISDIMYLKNHVCKAVLHLHSSYLHLFPELDLLLFFLCAAHYRINIYIIIREL